MEALSNRALISRLFTSANEQLNNASFDSENWSERYQVVQELTGPEKIVYVIVKLNQSITNGGFVEFYESSFGIFAPEIIHALNEIKADLSTDIISDSLSIINPNGLLDNAFKEFAFKLELSELQKAQLYALDVRYDQLHGIENLEDLLGGFLQAFVG